MTPLTQICGSALVFGTVLPLILMQILYMFHILPCFFLGCICESTNGFVTIQNTLFQCFDLLLHLSLSLCMTFYRKWGGGGGGGYTKQDQFK